MCHAVRLSSAKAFSAKELIHLLFWERLVWDFFVSPYEGSVLLYGMFLYRAESNLLACSITRACLWLLLCLGIDRRCGRCYLSPCFLLCHMETIRSSPRKIQLAIASTRRSLLSTEARARGIHISSLSGTCLF